MAFELIRKQNPKYLVIHHSATDTSVEATTLIRRSLHFARSQQYAQELKRKGYKADYHWYITPEGACVEGQPVHLNSCHAFHDDYNNQSLAVCLIGNIEKHRPSEKQYRTLVRLGITARKSYPGIQFLKHSDLVRTACPGKLLTWEALMKDIQERRIEITLRSHTAYVNGKAYTLDCYPFSVNSIIDGKNRTLIELRFLAEALGATVEWDEATKTIRISN